MLCPHSGNAPAEMLLQPRNDAGIDGNDVAVLAALRR
jgi:hypothetical protein